MLSSYHTVSVPTFEDLDQLAFREYLIKEKICESLVRDEAMTPPASSSSSSFPSPTAGASYWDRAKSIAELVFSHTSTYKIYNYNMESSKRHAADKREVYRNVKVLKALCTQGKSVYCCLVSTSRLESVKCSTHSIMFCEIDVGVK